MRDRAPRRMSRRIAKGRGACSQARASKTRSRFPNGRATPSKYNLIIKFTFKIGTSILLMRLMESQIERTKVMERNINTSIDEIIDLGSVSEETRGSVLGHDDTLGGRQINAGLSDD